MRLVFTNADQDTFDEYRSRFAARVRERGGSVSPSVLKTVLDYKFGEPDAGGDGQLAQWHRGDVAALLLDWLPRLGGADLPSEDAVRTALEAWFGLLTEQEWWDPRSDSVAELLAVIGEVAEGYQRAAANRAEHHIASYMTEVMVDNDIDIEDPEQVADFERRVDAGEIDVDFALLSGLADGSIEPPPSFLSGAGRFGASWRAPVLLEGAALDAAITAAPGYAALKEEFDALDDMYDDVAADADADPRAGDPVLVWDFGFESIADDLLDITELDEDGFDEAFDADPEDVVEQVLMVLFMERLPMPENLVGELVADMCGALDDSAPATGQVALFDRAAGFVLGELRRHGAVVREEHGQDADAAGGPVVSLTPLGEWAAYRELTDAGYDIRTFDELMAESAEVLVERAASGEPGGDLDLEAWIEARDIESAVRELTAVAVRTDDSTHRATVSAATAERALLARPVYEELLEVPAAGRLARTWLFHAGFRKESDLQADDLEWHTVDAIAAMARMDLMDDEQIADLPVRRQGGVPSIIDLAVEHQHPEAAFLLSWLGEHHSDAAVRKEARTALFRLSSRGA
ncbi:hypothetical protein CLV63_11878 [Murinocardiopsis flavida]|uniref:Uncharacterized protein n=1 Tax=Murinocardiopsis flavida TaxID=645275 RepID=A0A2P8D547_9ACTN|nr:hypothetical protein [Murinocardiopsis flavida]PSK92319.1 hypothetical protein CLV63_11878 [Murinocardiopsis flavida]